jgi:hypothetical protein
MFFLNLKNKFLVYRKLKYSNYLDNIHYISKRDLWYYEFKNLSKNEFLIKFINNTAHDLAKSENLNVYILPSNEMVDCVGAFKYFGDKNYTLYDKYKNILNKIEGKEKYKSLPRIELSDNASVFTFLHELGHYFIYKNNGEQSEENADKYIYDFINEHLPPFFKWVFNIEIKVRSEIELEFTDKECFHYYKECWKFIESNEI